MDRPIPASSWVVDGLLLAGEYPGANTAACARHKLEAFLETGIAAFFDLTEAAKIDAILAAGLECQLVYRNRIGHPTSARSCRESGEPKFRQLEPAGRMVAAA